MNTYRGNKFDNLDRPLKSVVVSQDKEQLTLSFQEGPDAVFKVYGDCCSQSWIEHMEMPKIVGEKITGASDVDIPAYCNTDDRGEYIQVYETRFHTEKGDIVVEYRNSSNGYYGGSIERIS